MEACTCPEGQLYSTTFKKCYAPEKCPRCEGGCAGDPHCTTFDGASYTVFPSCSHVVAEDCVNRTWFVVQVASNNCSGRAPTCIDESILIVPRLKTALHYNSITNSYWFVGSTPSTDDLIVIHIGNRFKAHLRKEDIVVSHWERTLKVSANIQWAGKICGLLGTCDGNKSNDLAFRNGSLVSNPSDPQFLKDYAYNISGICDNNYNRSSPPEPPSTPPSTPPPTPPPTPNCSESSLSEAKKFCSVMYNSTGPYHDCQRVYPAGNTYDDTIDSPFEQCVFDHCEVGKKVACDDILAYADRCSILEATVGKPPACCSEFLMTFQL